MGIRFEPNKRPSYQDYLDQAAGTGFEFEPNSLKEVQFVAFCEVLWTHAFSAGVDALHKKISERPSDAN